MDLAADMAAHQRPMRAAPALGSLYDRALAVSSPTNAGAGAGATLTCEHMRAASERRVRESPFTHSAGGSSSASTPLMQGKGRAGLASPGPDFRFLGSGSKQRVDNYASSSTNITACSSNLGSIAQSRRASASPPHAGGLGHGCTVSPCDPSGLPIVRGPSLVHTPCSGYQLSYTEEREAGGETARPMSARSQYAPSDHAVLPRGSLGLEE